MSIEWVKFIPKRSSHGRTKDSGPTYTSVWLVRLGGAADWKTITDAVPAFIGQVFPEADGTFVVCKNIDVKAADDAGLLWEVSAKYEPLEPSEGSDPGGGEGGTQFPVPVWSASGSSSTVPVFVDRDNQMIVNSAGDPLEGLEKEKSEFALTLTKPYPTHDAFLSVARTYTDTCNLGAWNGGAEHTWLCRFRNASLESRDGLIFWTTQWEFAYREDTWALKPWDIGFHELSGGDGTTGSPATGPRKAIVGGDGKPVKQPVALSNGKAKEAGLPPDVIRDGAGAKVYADLDFNAAFGQIFTPQF